jgi:predicted RNase H-like HicB family nuclease
LENEVVMNWMRILKSPTRRHIETRQVSPDSVLRVIFKQGEDGYNVAECPQLPGCMSQGKTKDEAAQNIVDAIKSVLAVRMWQSVSEAIPNEREAGDLEGEESFRVQGPELIPC